MQYKSILLTALVALSNVINGLPVISSNNDHNINVLNNLQDFKANSNNVTELLMKNEKFLKQAHYVVVQSSNISKDDGNGLETPDYLTCFGCKAGVTALQFYIEIGLSDSNILSQIHMFCSSLGIATENVCNGVTNLFGLELVYVLRHSPLGASDICSFMLEGTCPNDFALDNKWDVKIPPIPKPTHQEIPIPKTNAPRLKVLHLSDNHFDPEYIEGANANCADPLCCRKKSGRPNKAEDRAGKWGDYRKCDTPKRTIDHLYQHIISTHPDIDYIIWTGDLPPHDVWQQTRQGNLDIIKETAQQLFQYFSDIPIFPALGNHESAPVDTFPPHFLSKQNISTSWLYNELEVIWKQLLPTNATMTVRNGAYYSVLVKPGFRIISINTNYCNNKNFWLLLNSTDPDNELQWLINELQMAELANEMIHIIGHIPPGSEDCLEVWSRNFYKIIGRYENTIKAQFYGHTHYDELEIFFDPVNLARPTSIAYVAPSVTPYYNLNPGYRIYYIDGDHNQTTRIVTDHETWVMDLKKANAEDNPVWYKLYSAMSAYGMRSLRPVDWDVTIKQMAKNSTLFDMYYKHYWKDSHLRPACNSNCQKLILCDARSGRSHDRNSLCLDKIKQKQETAIKKKPTIWDSVVKGGLNAISNSAGYIRQQFQLLTNQIEPWL